MILGVAFCVVYDSFSAAVLPPARRSTVTMCVMGIWCLIMPAAAMLYNTVFFAYCLRFARKHEVHDYRSYNNAFYGKFAPVFFQPVLRSCISV